MNKFPRPVLENIGDSMFELAQSFFKDQGDVPPQLYGITVRDGKVKKVHAFELGRDFREGFPKLLRQAQLEYPAVVWMFGGWSAPDDSLRPSEHPERREVVTITVYAQGSTGTLTCPVSRNPDRLEKGEYEEPLEVTGRMTASGDQPIPHAQTRRLAEQLEDALRRRPERWRDISRNRLGQLLEGQRLTEAFDVLINWTLPQESLDFVHAQWELRCAYVESDSKIYSLCGAYIRVQRPLEADSVDGVDPEGLAQDALRIWANSLPESKLSFCTPEAPVLLAGFVPATLLHNALFEQLANDRGGPGAGGTRLRQGWHMAQLREKAAAALDSSYDDGYLVDTLDFIVLGVFESEKVAEEAGAVIEGTVLREARDKLKLLQDGFGQAVIAAGKLQGVEASLGTLAPTFETLRLLYRHQFFSAVASQVRSCGRLTAQGAAGLRIEVTGVAQTLPPKNSFVYVTVWSEAGKLLGRRCLQGLPHHGFPAVVEEVAQFARDEGCKDVRVYPRLLAVEKLSDAKSPGGLLVPDFHGGWLSAQDAIAPGSLDMVRRLTWLFNPESSADPLVQALPMPLRLGRLGLMEAASAHYSPNFYQDLRVVLANSQLDRPTLWESMKRKYPKLEGVEERVKGSVIPPVHYEYAMRANLAKAPTLKVRQTLVDRLAHTQMDLRLPASFLRAPHPLCYIHFEAPLTHVEWTLGEGEAARLEGAFVNNVALADGRRRTHILLVAKGVTDWTVQAVLEVVVTIADEHRPIIDCIGEWAKQEDMPDDVLQAFLPALEEVLKVLLYMGLRDARLVEHTQWSTAMKETAGKSFEKQQKIRHKARGLFDHIEVGPELPMEMREQPGLSNPTMPIHVRRGFINKFWTGKGRTVLKLQFIEPVVVNKRLLVNPDEPPTPKDFRLR